MEAQPKRLKSSDFEIITTNLKEEVAIEQNLSLGGGAADPARRASDWSA